MSQQYDDYLREHIDNVEKGIGWMIEHHLVPQDILWTPDGASLEGMVRWHDESKMLPEEYNAYDDYFYGKEGKDEDDIAVIDATFDYAWLHHQKMNPHHWQYWVLLNDDDGMKALEMPAEYVYEMIADWWSFSWRSGNLKEIFSWYDSHKEKMILHPKTQALVEDILNKMRAILGPDDELDSGGEVTEVTDEPTA